MAIDLANYEQKAHEAVKIFWESRQQARQKQSDAGKADQGERAGVTAGKNMDGFLALVIDIVRANGLDNAEIHQERRVPSARRTIFGPPIARELLANSHGLLPDG